MRALGLVFSPMYAAEAGPRWPVSLRPTGALAHPQGHCCPPGGSRRNARAEAGRPQAGMPPALVTASIAQVTPAWECRANLTAGARQNNLPRALEKYASTVRQGFMWKQRAGPPACTGAGRCPSRSLRGQHAGRELQVWVHRRTAQVSEGLVAALPSPSLSWPRLFGESHGAAAALRGGSWAGPRRSLERVIWLTP